MRKKETPVTAETVCVGGGEWGIERKAVEVALPFRPALRKSKKCFPTTYSTAREVEPYCVFRVIKEEGFFFFLATCARQIIFIPFPRD